MNFLKRQIIKAEQSEGVSNLSRRTFLQAVGVGGGLLIGSGFLVSAAAAASDDQTGNRQNKVRLYSTPFLKITLLIAK